MGIYFLLSSDTVMILYIPKITQGSKNEVDLTLR
jgi:hypothetical protein